jgi:TetR/AcrR family transcriptional regulator, mexJK operon transcriptional repressor
MNNPQAVVEFEETPQTKKEQEVLRVASDYFLSHGYKGTSINAMARDAGISKESIYRYFSSKKKLFEAVILKELSDYRKRLDFLNIGHDTMPLDAALRQAGVSILQAVSSDRVLALRRLVFHEATRSPEIGQIYYAIGPQAAYDYLVRMFEAHRAESKHEPSVLAEYFVAMVLHKTMLQRECAVIEPLTREQIGKHAARVTDQFLELFFNT